MMKLTAWGIAVITAYIVFMSLSGPNAAMADPYIVGLIGVTLLVSSGIMVAFTREWSVRALGMMSTALGCGVLYLASLLFYVAPETRQWSAPVTSAVRAFLVVGGPLWALGIIWWVRSRVTQEEEA